MGGVEAGRYTLVLKNDGFGVGVGVGAASIDRAKPTSKIDIGQKILRNIIQLVLTILSKAMSVRATLNALYRKNFERIFVHPLTAHGRTASIGVRARENFYHAND